MRQPSPAVMSTNTLPSISSTSAPRPLSMKTLGAGRTGRATELAAAEESASEFGPGICVLIRIEGGQSPV
jgi:hypothetical protein